MGGHPAANAGLVVVDVMVVARVMAGDGICANQSPKWLYGHVNRIRRSSSHAAHWVDCLSFRSVFLASSGSITRGTGEQGASEGQ
jgi:hypothetical protein